jgi:hypothetical protein
MESDPSVASLPQDDVRITYFIFAPARIANPLNVVCAALRPSRKSLSLKVE